VHVIFLSLTSFTEEFMFRVETTAFHVWIAPSSMLFSSRNLREATCFHAVGGWAGVVEGIAFGGIAVEVEDLSQAVYIAQWLNSYFLFALECLLTNSNTFLEASIIVYDVYLATKMDSVIVV